VSDRPEFRPQSSQCQSREDPPTDRLDELEERIGKLTERVVELEEKVTEQGTEIEKLETDVADLEARLEDREWQRLAYRALVADLDHALGIQYMPFGVRLAIEELGAML
jgi:predicted RNase H-like nuclease (RuvC/YqgF family)